MVFIRRSKGLSPDYLERFGILLVSSSRIVIDTFR